MTIQARKPETGFPQVWPRYADLAYAHGGPVGRAVLRERPEDFNVVEELGFQPTNDGQHVLLRIQKTGMTTDMLAGLLAKYAGTARRNVSYAGLKDKIAVTTQWFSVNLAGCREPDWQQFRDAGYHVTDIVYNRKKIQRGALKSNRFDITLRHLDSESAVINDRLGLISAQGVPNYFAEQRFGRDEKNIDSGLRMLRGEFRIRDRHRRGIYLSAVRSCLFNMLLSERVKRGNWNRALPGDTFMLSGTKRCFQNAEVTPDIIQRVETMDIHPTGPLVGDGQAQVSGEAAAIEHHVMQPYSGWCHALAAQGMKNDRRSLRLQPGAMSWQCVDEDQLRLQFSLPPGAYATSVLRELVQYSVDRI